jgi:predicted transcriptional regulator of viral defense system
MMASARTRLDLTRLRAVGTGAYFAPRHLSLLGLTRRQLDDLVADGIVERVARGLYRLTAVAPTEQHTLATVCARVPSGIVCLLSALQFHGLGTQLPRQVWLAIPHRAKAPRLTELPVRILRFSGAALQHGLQAVLVEGVPTRVTSPARTVVDCFRLQRLVGRDVALEALRDAVHTRKATTDEIWRAAQLLRSRRLLAPALELLSV